MTTEKSITIGTLVQTIFGDRVCRVTAIDTVTIIDSTDATGTHSHEEARYHLEYGQYDFVNGFNPLHGDNGGTTRVVRSEIARIF